MSKKKNDWNKVLTESYVASMHDLSDDELEKELISCEFAIKKTLEEKREDTQLNAAKEIVKDLNKGYNSAVKYEKAKIEFLLEKIEALRAAKQLYKES